VPLISDDQLQPLVASGLQKSDPNDLGASTDSFASAVTSAEQEIRGALLDRGYSAATIASWDRLEEYHGIVARYILCSLVRSVAMAYPVDQIDSFAARKKELVTVRVFVAGELVNPDRGAREDVGGSVGYRRMTAESSADHPASERVPEAG
jgi:hypothetical protein